MASVLVRFASGEVGREGGSRVEEEVIAAGTDTAGGVVSFVMAGSKRKETT